MSSDFRHQFSMLLLCAAAVTLFAAGTDAQVNKTQNDKAALQQIEAAWKRRTDAIRSIELKADMYEFIKGRGDKPFVDEGPFTDSPPIGDRIFNVSLEFAFERGKAAVMRSGPVADVDDPEKTHQQTDRATFDGHTNMRLGVQTGLIHMGSVERNETCSDRITRDANFLAVNLWLQPRVVLGPVGNWVERMRVEEAAADVDGISCRRINISGGSRRRTNTIDVDPSKDYVPVQWLTTTDGRPSMKVTIKYGIDKKTGPVANEWTYSRYSSTGDIEQIRSARVTQHQVNADIDDKRFTIEFPVGTQVVESIGGIDGKRLHFIQRANGLEPIKQNEYGNPKINDLRDFRQRETKRVPAKFVALAADEKTVGSMTRDRLQKAGFTSLIEDNSLSAWDTKSWHEGHWTIKDGVIDYDGKATGKRRSQDNSLWTKKNYGGFTIYAEWRLHEKPTMHPTPIVLFNGDFLLDENNKRITRPQLDAGDSGLMFRGTSKCQANIWCQDLGSGEINGYRTDRKMPPSIRRACIPIKKADRPMGEWNAFLITMKGDRMTVELNGERVIDAAELPGVPTNGPIGLQHHGDPVQFRQIWVKTLN